MSTNNALALFEPQNIGTIATLAPQAFSRNTTSHDRCVSAGQFLLQQVSEKGMSAELDAQIADYIKKTKITLTKMNERRSPVTKLFDTVRSAYTEMENDINPSNSSSIPAQLQKYRNAYAAEQHAKAERERQAEMLRQRQQALRMRYCDDVKADFRAQLSQLIEDACRRLADMERATTLENYDATINALKTFEIGLPSHWASGVKCRVALPAGMQQSTAESMQASALADMIADMKEQVIFEVGSVRDDILDRMPSKRAELQRAKEASAEEAAQIARQIALREQQEALRLEEERAHRAEKEKAAAEFAAESRKADSLFDSVAVAQPLSDMPKTKVRKRIAPQTPEDFMAIIGLWWSREGANLSTDELGKIFKKQITFCEKLANDKKEPVIITGITYVDEIKAK